MSSLRTKRSVWHEWILSKLGLATVSLVLAATAWVFVNSGQTVQQKRPIKLQYVQRPSGLVFQQNPLKEAKAELSGSLYQLRAIRDDDLVYLVDLAGARPGPNRIEIRPEQVRLPVEIEMGHLEPRAFNVYLEEIFVRSLPVRLVPKGAPKPGFSLIEARPRPESVSVSGPKSVVSKLEYVEVPIELANRDKAFDFSVQPGLNLPDTEVLETVEVRVDVAPLKFNREISAVPVVVVGGMPGSMISPKTADLVIEGTQQESGEWSGNIEVTVSVHGLKKGRYRLRGKVELPPGLKLVSIQPQYFIVEVNP